MRAGVARVRRRFVQDARQIQAGGDGADRPGQHVIEQQRRDRELSQAGAHGLVHHAIHAARTNMLQLSMYTARTAYENSMMAKTNQGADFPMAVSAMPPT